MKSHIDYPLLIITEEGLNNNLIGRGYINPYHNNKNLLNKIDFDLLTWTLTGIKNKTTENYKTKIQNRKNLFFPVHLSSEMIESLKYKRSSILDKPEKSISKNHFGYLPLQKLKIVLDGEMKRFLPKITRDIIHEGIKTIEYNTHEAWPLETGLLPTPKSNHDKIEIQKLGKKLGWNIKKLRMDIFLEYPPEPNPNFKNNSKAWF